MKVRNIAIAALLVIGASTNTPAVAATDANDLRSDIYSSMTDDGNLTVTVAEDTAYISGYAHQVDLAKAKRIAQSADGIDNVVVTATSIN